MTRDNLLVEFERLSQTFGGTNEVGVLLTAEQIEYILLYSGFISIVRPWSLEIDLSFYDYINGTPCRILNENLEELYSYVPNGSVFGLNPKDVETVALAKHGALLHISFETTKGIIIGLLWVCNQLSPRQISSQIQAWELQIDSVERRQPEHEIFFDPGDLVESKGQLKVYFLAGVWEQQYTPTEVINNDKTVSSSYDVDKPLVLYPQRSGWYIFAQVKEINGVEVSRDLLLLDALTGIGSRRIRETADFSFFIHLQNDNLAAPMADPLALFGTTGTMNWFDAEPRMRLQASLAYSRYAYAEGTSTAIADPDVNPHFCNDILESDMFGGVEYLTVDVIATDNFFGYEGVTNDCGEAYADLYDAYAFGTSTAVAVSYMMKFITISDINVELTSHIEADSSTLINLEAELVHESVIEPVEIGDVILFEATLFCYNKASVITLEGVSARIDCINIITLAQPNPERGSDITLDQETMTQVTAFLVVAGEAEIINTNTVNVNLFSGISSEDILVACETILEVEGDILITAEATISCQTLLQVDELNNYVTGMAFIACPQVIEADSMIEVPT